MTRHASYRRKAGHHHDRRMNPMVPANSRGRLVAPSCPEEDLYDA